MSRELLRLTESICNKPQLMGGTYLDTVYDYLQKRNTGLADLKVDQVKRKINSNTDVTYNADTGVGIISMDGPLTYLHYEGLCEESGPSYEMIKAQFDFMADNGAKVIVLDQDSGGGMAFGSFETAEAIRAKADELGIKILAYVDGISASASYVFSAIADEVIVNPQAEVGSIGVVIKLRNINKAVQAAGVEDSYVFAGKGKVPFKADGSFEESFLDDLAYKVENLYEGFVSHVSDYRGVPKQDIIEFGAKMFIAQDAIKAGLADKIMNHEEFANYLATLTEEGNNMAIFEATSKPNMKDLESANAVLTASLEQAQVSMVDLQAELDGVQTSLLAKVEALQTELAEATSKTKELETAKRKKLLEDATSTEQAEALYASLETLNDEAYATVVAGFATSNKALESSDLFTEMGDQGVEVVLDKPKASSKTKELAQAKYQSK